MRPKVAVAALALAVAPLPWAAEAAARPVDFTRDVLPIFNRACVSCHGPDKAQGGLQLGSARRVAKGGIADDLLVPRDPAKSYLVRRLRGEGGEPRMPWKAPALPTRDLALIERWISEGAALPIDGPARFVPGPGGLKRLTIAQYHATVRALFGPAVPLPDHLEPDTLVSGSAVVGAARVELSPQGVEKFARGAATLARAAVADPAFRARHLACAAGEACNRALVRDFGRRAWRRPLTGDEIERYTRLGGDRADAAEVIVTALLQSPHFLYRAEIGVPDPEDPTRRRLDGFELASRLSYFLWGGPPDDALMAAAESGALATREGLAAEARRLLASPRARASLSAFFVELFRLRRLDRLSESHAGYPQYSPTLAASLRGEALRLIEEVAFDPARDFRTLFSSRHTWVNRELARLYRIDVPALAAAEPDHYVRVALPPARVGLLSQGSFLAIFSHASASSPTRRGKFIREGLLCQGVPPPPPNVNTRLPRDDAAEVRRTTRQKLEAHRKDERCNGCHKALDPLGLAFEHFDGIGAFRADEAGQPIDASGELDGAAFEGAAGLGALLAASPRLGACVARSLFRFAVGHLETEAEEPLFDELARGLERDGYRFEALVSNVITSEGFRTIAAPAPTAAPRLARRNR